jgi:hypothetical protein
VFPGRTDAVVHVTYDVLPRVSVSSPASHPALTSHCCRRLNRTASLPVLPSSRATPVPGAVNASRSTRLSRRNERLRGRGSRRHETTRGGRRASAARRSRPPRWACGARLDVTTSGMRAVPKLPKPDARNPDTNRTFGERRETTNPRSILRVTRLLSARRTAARIASARSPCARW